MGIVSGHVYLDPNNDNTGTIGIANVPVVLQNTSTGIGLAVLTDSSGYFQFNTVPNASYRLVECYGFSSTTPVQSPGDFGTAVSIPVPIGTDPAVSLIVNPPAGTNRVQSTTPNTIFFTIASSNWNGVVFRDAPFINTPLSLQDVSYTGGNLITVANGGNWGTLPAGTPSSTFAPTAPYPGVVPGFPYVAARPQDGEYTVANIPYFAAFYVADHTSGDETGRAQLINGANPGNLFFTQTVNVKPNTTYQFSTWMCNLSKGALPKLGYEIKTTAGTILFQDSAPSLPFSTPREWLQFGTFFNSGNNAKLQVNLLSLGAGAGGNDYMIDDIALIETTLSDILTVDKYTSKQNASIGDELDYSIVLTNKGTSTITNLVIVDTTPNGVTFNTGSLQVNGTTLPLGDPTNLIITSPPMPLIPNEVITINYKVTIYTIPNPNPIPNSATANYAYAPQNGGITVPNASVSNVVETLVRTSNIAASKFVDKAYASIGEILTYTIPITNYSTITLNNVVLIDTIPNGTSFIIDSLTVDNIKKIGFNPSPPLGAAVGDLGKASTKTVSFKVMVVTLPTINPITNSATINYSYNLNSVTYNSGTTTNDVSTQINSASFSNITKYVDKSYADCGDVLNYTIVVPNSGNTTAVNVLFTDTTPNGTTFISGSFRYNGLTLSNANPNNGVILRNIGGGTTATLTYQVKVDC